jgi:GNAT superfamily N-acetyltransferase
MKQFTIAPLTPDTVDLLADAFAPAPYAKQRAQYARYLAAHTAGTLVTLVAWADAVTVCGYVNLLWHSDYPPFARAAIPEINDLNVLVPWRRRGIGKALIAAAELIARGADLPQVGMGVGVTPDDDVARRLYPLLGYVWDGRGPQPTAYGPAEYLTKALASDAPAR